MEKWMSRFTEQPLCPLVLSYCNMATEDQWIELEQRLISLRHQDATQLMVITIIEHDLEVTPLAASTCLRAVLFPKVGSIDSS
jgi:hypothetical protein